MMTDKYIEKLLNLYFKGELPQKEKDILFESLRTNPDLNDTVQFVLSHTDPSKAELFLSERSLMCDTQPLSEHDETLIELYLSSLMSPKEEADFIDKLESNADLRTNVFAQAILIKAIQKIRITDNAILDAAKNTTASDVKTLFKELREEDDDVLIDSYLMGNLSEDEMKSFEERINSDKDFKERVSTIAFLSKGIKERQERDVKAIEDANKISKEDVISTIKEIEEREKLPVASPVAHTAAVMPLWAKRVAAAAAVILIMVGVGYYFLVSNINLAPPHTSERQNGVAYNSAPPHTSEQQNGVDYNSAPQDNSELWNNAEQCILLAESNLSKDIFMKGDNEALISDLRKLFENVRKKENLSSTIEKLEEYYKNSIDEYVHVEDDSVDQISLALASAYIYNGQKYKAKDVLNHILNDPNARLVAKEKAKQLFDSIKKSITY